MQAGRGRAGEPRSGSFGGARVRLAGLFVLCGLVAGCLPPGPAFENEDFNACAVDPLLWSVVDPLGGGSAQVVGGGTGDAHLELSVAGGSSHDLTAAGNDAVRLAQSTVNARFNLVARIDSPIAQAGALQGIFVEQSDSRYVYAAFGFDGAQAFAELAGFWAGTTFFSETVPLPGGVPSYLRILRREDTMEFAYSYDGIAFSPLPTVHHRMEVKALGPFAANRGGAAAPAHVASFDYVFRAYQAVGFEDAAPVGSDNTLTLQTSGPGSGSVAPTPDQPTYACGTVVSLQATPDPGYRFAEWSGDVTGPDNPSGLFVVRDHTVDGRFEVDPTPPEVSDVAAAGTTDSLTVSWTTDLPATSRVDYGLTPAFELGFVEDSALVQSHQLLVPGLTAGSTIHYRVVSASGSGQTTVDGGRTAELPWPPGQDPSGFVSDDFNGCGLDPAWTFEDPALDASLDLSGARTGQAVATLGVPGGSDHSAAGATNGAPRLMQSVVDGDLQVEAVFASAPSLDGQQQGVLLEETPGRYLAFQLERAGGGLLATVRYLDAGSATLVASLDVTALVPDRLQVERNGAQWIFRVSADGETYTQVDQFLLLLALSRVGVHGGNTGGAGAPAFDAVVDSFASLASPVVPEDDTTPFDFQLSLDAAPPAGGTATPTPDLPGYDCGEVVSVAASPAAGYDFTGWSGDAAGSVTPVDVTMNGDRSVTAGFAPTPPVLSDVGATPSLYSATITWTTDVPATSVVDYGVTPGYELGTVESTSLVTSHSVPLAGLQTDTIYHYRVRSVTAQGGSAESGDQTFKTAVIPNPSGMSSDDFNTCALDTRLWRVEDPLGDATVSIVGAGTGLAELRIQVPGGSNHDLWSPNTAPRVVQPVLDDDLAVVARFDSLPTLGFQVQGIVVQESPTRFQRFDFQHTGSNLRLFAGSVIDGVTTTRGTTNISSSGPLYLRVERVGDQWTQEWSEDGQSWTEVASFSSTIQATAAGVFAGNFGGGSAPPFTARVDFVEVAADPIVAEDSGVPPTSTVLTVQQTGLGTVDVSPDQTVFSCGDPVTLTATPDPGYEFVGWQGAGLSPPNPVTFAMVEDRTVTADFTVDSTPPVVSNLRVEAGPDAAWVRWETNEPATAVVEFGETAGYELGSVNEPTLVTSGELLLEGLAPDTLHHFELTVTDALANGVGTGDQTFTTGLAPGVHPSGILSDDFDACSLDLGLWTVVDPLADGSVEMLGAGSGSAQLRLTVPPDVEHSPGAVNESLRIVQPANDTDFELEVKFESAVTVPFQEQGILIEAGNGDWLRFDFYNDGADTYSFVGSYIGGGSTTEGNNLVAGAGSELWMRVERVGDTWTQSFSVDGVVYTPGASFTQPLAVAEVGVFAGNEGFGAVVPGHTAVIDYFHLTASPIVPADVSSTPTASVLDLEVIGSGSVQVDPDQPFYGCGEEVSLTATPDPGFEFSGWSGDLSGSDPVETLLMTANRSVDATFVVDVTPPAIQNLAITPFKTGALVAWETDEPATSEVFYGETPAYGSSVSSGSYVTEHAMLITGLTLDLQHHLQVESVDSAALGSTSPDQVFQTLPDLSGIDSDDFNDCDPDPGLWLFVDPVGDSSASTTGVGSGDAQLVIDVPGGVSHNPWSINQGARLLQSAADEDLEIQARFDSQVTTAFQIQGLLVEESASRFLLFDVYHDGSDTILRAASVVDGATDVKSEVVVPDGPIYLRAERIGHTWTQLYSTDGVAWTPAVSFNHVMVVGGVGVVAGNFDGGAGAPPFTMVVDWFENGSSLLVGEDAAPAPYTSTLSASVAGGMGQVVATPDQVEYSCGETVQVFAEPAAGYSFVDWSGDLTGPANPQTLLMDQNRTVTANLEVDTSPPVISNVQVVPSLDQATISWTTDEPTTSVLQYGETMAYGTSVVNGTEQYEHQAVIGPLQLATLYHFEITVTDRVMLASSTGDLTFESLLDPSGIDSDDFNAENVDRGLWTLVDPLGGAEVRILDAGTSDVRLGLRVPGDGAEHDAWAFNAAPRLLQASNDTDFDVQIKLDSSATADTVIQGLLVEDDPGHYLRFSVDGQGGSSRLVVVSVENGGAQVLHQEPVVQSGSLWLRIVRVGDGFEFLTSDDGSVFSSIHQATHTMAVSAVGFFAGNAGPAPAHEAVADAFFLTAFPISPEDGGVPPPDATAPWLQNVRTTVTPTSVAVDWATDEPADSMVEIGLTPALELTPISDAGPSSSHSLVAVPLDPETRYYLRVSSEDAAGNLAQTGIFTADTPSLSTISGPDVDVWYGDVQDFGQLGLVQPWVNVLGNVSDPDGVAFVTASLNGAPAVTLELGPDERRLWNAGDFNVEIDVADLDPGANYVTLTSEDVLGNQTTRLVTVDWTPGVVWPAATTVTWGSDPMDRPGDFAWVVDGLWELDGAGGLRTTEVGYDRLVGVGDLSWTSYEITVPITIHAIGPVYPSPSNSPALGFVGRWPGHLSKNGESPGFQWWPLGCFAAYRFTQDGNEGFQILGGNGPDFWQANPGNLVAGGTYWFKLRVEDVGGGLTDYSLRVWEDGQPEPGTWDVTGTGDALSPQTGSALIVAHHVDVTIGTISVVPIP